jgi:RNA polymerase sigma-70 factor, ECF subfamily
VSPPRSRGTAAPPGVDLVALLALVAKGDQAAFEAVYDRVCAPVFGTVRSVVRDPGLSEEVTQEVFVEVWRTASRFDAGKGSPMAWVATIAQRRAVDRVRSEQRSAERDRRAASSVIAYDDVAETVEDNLDRERVLRCLGTLTDLQREAVTLAIATPLLPSRYPSVVSNAAQPAVPMRSAIRNRASGRPIQPTAR